MITRITGVLSRVLDEEARVQCGAFEYAVLVPEYVRRIVQNQVGQEVTLHTSHYFDGNPMQGRVVPRLIGFVHEAVLQLRGEAGDRQVPGQVPEVAAVGNGGGPVAGALLLTREA